MPVDHNNMLPPASSPVPPHMQQIQFDEYESGFKLGEIIATLLEYKWVILGITSLALLVGGFKLFNDTPIFRVDATLQIEGGKGG
jgi:uncharacterized protein involved in exopolysaccharide biosynthesis